MDTDVASELSALTRFLRVQRNHVLGIVDGLSEEELRRPVLPSGWSCLGMVQHLAFVERLWFRAVIAGEQEAIDLVRGQNNSWQVASNVPAADVLEGYRREASLADAIIAACPVDAGLAWWPFPDGEWRLDNVREVLLHVIAEAACHAGHLDAVRELIDGRQWMVNS